MLSHVSIRARNLKVALVVLFNEDEFARLKREQKKCIEIKVIGEEVSYSYV